MKRYFCILSLTGLVLTSCDKTVIDGELPSDIGGKNSIEVLRSSIVFSPDGGDGYVVVKTEGPITARSTREKWCSVDCFGDSVAVHTQNNYGSLDTRFAQVIIYHGKDSVALNVHQEGPMTVSFDDSAVVFDYEAGEGEIKFRSNMLPEVTSNVNWATAEISKNLIKVNVRRNTTQSFRSGVLTCKLGTETYKVTVMQLDAAEILTKRNWKVEGTLTNGNKITMTGLLSRSGSNYVMALTGNGINWSWNTGMNGNTLTIPLGTSIGRYLVDENNYYVFPMVGEGDNAGTASEMVSGETAGFSMNYDKNADRWSGTFQTQTYTQFQNPTFRFEYWINSSHTGISSGGLRFRELTITQQ